jgi:hypothetical protein
VPAMAPPQSMPAAPSMEHESEGLSKTTLIALWSFVGVFALGCVLILVWYSHSMRQARLAAANDRIAQGVAIAQKWMAGNSPMGGEVVERQLADALKDEDATEKGDGESMLRQVRQHQEQLAEQIRVERAQR